MDSLSITVQVTVAMKDNEADTFIDKNFERYIYFSSA